MDTTKEQILTAAAAGAFNIGGDLTVNRMGYGAMQITVAGVWGPPVDKAASLSTLRRAIELGVNLIDTADSYDPGLARFVHRKITEPCLVQDIDLTANTHGDDRHYF